MADRTDADIQRDVLESLYWDTRVDAADVGVLVDEGRVTLVGTVPTYRARAAAEEDARVVRHVIDVDNRLAVAISPELDTPDDDALRTAVLDVLAADPDLAATDIDVEVEAGTVRLSGSVPTFWERELARSVTTSCSAGSSPTPPSVSRSSTLRATPRGSRTSRTTSASTSAADR